MKTIAALAAGVALYVAALWVANRFGLLWLVAVLVSVGMLLGFLAG